jgi:hypothetical protein
MDYTEGSRRTFAKAVADNLEYEVAERASEGPWMLSSAIHDAIQGQPAPDGSERHVCGLIDPNDGRAAVAGDPDSLRLLARAMRMAASDESTPPVVLAPLFELALRYNDSMLLKCSGLLRRVAATPPPEATQDDPGLVQSQVGANAAEDENPWG